MRKVVKITESNFIKLIKRIIKENDSYYDQILDLYNEVGLEGMTPDEIEYFKSGGTSELPKRFKTQSDLENDDEHFMVDWKKLDTLKKIVERISTDFEFLYDNMSSPKNLYFVIIFNYSEKLFNFLLNMFGDKPIPNTGIRPVKLKEDKILLTIPKSWFDELFSEPQ
jgi:hypothetical protein